MRFLGLKMRKKNEGKSKKQWIQPLRGSSGQSEPTHHAKCRAMNGHAGVWRLKFRHSRGREVRRWGIALDEHHALYLVSVEVLDTATYPNLYVHS